MKKKKPAHATHTYLKEAYFVKQMDGTGDGRVYRLSHPLEGHSYVWVSAINAPYSGPETFIFAWDRKKNRVKDWMELDGSYKGGCDHEKALVNAGYTIKEVAH